VTIVGSAFNEVSKTASYMIGVALFEPNNTKLPSFSIEASSIAQK
jgi:hypothetical protein